MSLPRASPRQIDALTSLRFFAALYVLLYHSGGPALVESGRLPAAAARLLSHGYLGVTFFFILSGFILTHVYLDRLTTRQDIATYALARLARIYPVYLLALLMMVPHVTPDGILHALPQFLLLQSWLPMALSDGHLVANWNMQGWSLSVELLFYIVLPGLLAAVGRADGIGLAALLAAVCLIMVGFGTPAIIDMGSADRAGLSWIPLPLLRAPELVYGVLLALVLARRRLELPAWMLPLAAVALVLVLASDGRWVAPVAALVMGLLIVSAAAGRQSLIGRWLQHPSIVLLGGASYALYILQLPVHLAVHSIAGAGHASVGRVLYIPVLIATSIAVHKLIEEPARMWIRSLRLPRLQRP